MWEFVFLRTFLDEKQLSEASECVITLPLWFKTACFHMSISTSVSKIHRRSKLL